MEFPNYGSTYSGSNGAVEILTSNSDPIRPAVSPTLQPFVAAAAALGGHVQVTRVTQATYAAPDIPTRTAAMQAHLLAQDQLAQRAEEEDNRKCCGFRCCWRR